MEERIYWIEYLRAIATILVLLLHTSASYLYEINSISNSSWMIGNIIDSFTRVSVPLFFMISGYLFFNKKVPKNKNYLRIIASILFYSLIAILYLKFYLDIPVLSKIKNILFQPVFYHLWFLYMIPLIYLVSEIITVRKTKNLRLLMIGVVLFILVNPGVNDFTSMYGLTFSSLYWFDGTIIYYFLYAWFGALIGNLPEFKKRNNLISVLLLLVYFISSIIIAKFTQTLSTNAGEYIGTFYKYTGVMVAFGAVSLFLLVKINFQKLKPLKGILLWISKLSLPIYGIHAIVLDFIKREGYRNYERPLVDISLTFIFVLVLSLLVGMGIKAIDKKHLVS
ncbi:MAG: hypothetical protein UR96_C0032G0007 [candidate division WS6 bacterium GW2011_GWC1_36_11]|uniref:Acyltransferase 3 domain-containing protein n=2 Tax=Candidatus Dojkabacteria TaxID=74243 RepID=A0A0G0FVH8_9BACT|nr:MAG: hypothetical protein UR96_C0032G0007 [candidate division WS6 bacterium GW2011_GWC1_36_11]KKQ14818.1 MAG: hypothetical protein US29_C0059G0008 [candidate division WS6 bacterium GW2011_GWF1_36_8]HAM37311.1 hypothetical protein [Patescibacteria group bacterium]HAM96583.1 hypothetical protein [Patescibacteria group bacterium]